MSLVNTAQMHLLERYLDLTSTRQALLVSNIANVDTPGYHTRDIDFTGELARASQQEDNAPTEPFVREVHGLNARPDGNNVSVDREGLLLSQVQLQFNAASQLVMDEIKTLKLAITSGGQ
jgi:flagellar basal-body rod protein FlgB